MFSVKSFAILSTLVATVKAQGIGLTEGPVFSIVENTDPAVGGAVLNVMGITLTLPQSSFDAGGILSGPGTVLSSLEVLNMEQLPGRTQPGFIGATCKCEVATIQADGSLIGQECILEAAENIMMTAVTGLGLLDAEDPLSCFLELGDAPLRVVRNTAQRYPFLGAIDAEGFEIDFCSIPLGAEVLAAGYYGDADNVFYAFEVESSLGDRAGAGDDTGAGGNLLTIARVRCRPGGRLEVRGAITNPDGTDVRVDTFDAAGVQTGTATVAVDPFDEVALVSGFRFRQDIVDCPATMVATSLPDGATFTAAVA